MSGTSEVVASLPFRTNDLTVEVSMDVAIAIGFVRLIRSYLIGQWDQIDLVKLQYASSYLWA